MNNEHEKELNRMKYKMEQIKLEVEQIKLGLISAGKLLASAATGEMEPAQFDIAKNLKLMPQFDESDVETFPYGPETTAKKFYFLKIDGAILF